MNEEKYVGMESYRLLHTQVLKDIEQLKNQVKVLEDEIQKLKNSISN